MSSDEHTSDEESRSDPDASSDSGSENDPHSLIDLEAEESGSDSSGTLDYTPHDAFPKFTELPPELRRRIWEVFCPDLVAKARVLPFMMSPSSAVMHRPDDHSVKDHLSLADQTEELRAMLATHQESRSVAVKVFPDELRMDAGSGDAIVRFNKERDVVCIHGMKYYHTYHLPGFGREVLHVTIVPWENAASPLYDTITKAKTLFPNMKRYYVLTQDFNLKDRHIQWCGSDYVHKYVVQTYRKEIGLGEDTEVMYCWPDLDRHADFAKYTIPKRTATRILDAAKEADVELLSMIEFEYEAGIARYETLRKMKDIPLLEGGSDSDDDDEEDEENESQPGTDTDEYESEGIDDEVIEEQDESSEDEIIPTGDAGRFSSPEVSDSDVEEVAPVQRSRKRKVVSDSDDDDEPQTKRVRSRIVIDSDEEEDVQPQKRARSAQVVSDSDDEEDVQIVEVRSKARSKRALASDSEDGLQNGSDESESEEESEEDEPPKRLSLAERLRKAREENPVSSGSEGEEDEEDDEEESEEEEDDDDEGGLLDVMADEGDDDEDEEEDGW